MLKIQKQRKMNSKLGALILSSLLSLSLFCNNNLNVDAKDNSRTESFNSEFERSTVNKKMKDILREIANNTSKDIVLNSIDLALNGDEFSEYFMGQAVLTFGLEQRKIKYADAYLEDCYNPYLYINYSLDDIRIVNNLNGAIKMFPKQICMLTKLADFSKYSIYEMYSDSPCYVITSKERVLAIGTVDGLKSVESECVDLTSLKDF